MPILWAIEEFDVPDEAAALLDTKTRHQKLIFHLGQRSIEWRLAHGTLALAKRSKVSTLAC